MRLLLFIFMLISLSNAAGGRQDFVCFGYGDGKNKVPGQQLYREGFTYTDPKGWCQKSGGCYVNCVDPRKDINNFIELFPDGQTPKLKLKDNGFVKREAKFWCQANFCYPPNGSLNGYDYSKYKNEVIICSKCGTRQYVARPAGSLPPDPDPDPNPNIDLVVEEQGYSKQNFIYTKTSGSSLSVKIYNKNSSSNPNSNLDSATCKVYIDSNVASQGNANKSSGGSFLFTTTLNKSGQHSIECEGIKNGKSYKSQRLYFYVAPAYYSAGMRISANGKNYTIQETILPSDGSMKSSHLASDTPILRVGDTMDVSLNGTKLNISKQKDMGTRTTMELKNAIKNTIEGLNSQSGLRVCKAGAPTLPSTSNIDIINGKFDGKVLSLKFDDVYNGEMELIYTDITTRNMVEQERRRGGCSGNGIKNGQCPIPPEFKFVFKYLVVPANFELSLKNGVSNIKVLYYGQGSSPNNEGRYNLQVTPVDSAKKPLKNFVDGCAAIDTELELNGKDLSIVFIDPNNQNISSTSTTIYAKDFKSNVDGSAIADLSRVLSIKRANGGDWKPSMVAEPSFLGADVNPLMYFTGKKNDSAYPQYTPFFDALNNVVVLRGRINAIDSDNADDYSKIPSTNVYYEFYCQICDLKKVGQVTGVQNYTGSTTSQGWWQDSTFGTYNPSKIQASNITTTGALKVSNVSPFSNSMQAISYQNAPAGKYEVSIKHGMDPNNFPLFLLYNPYFVNNNASNATSAFVTIYSKIQDEKRDFGVDMGQGKNTRSGSRTGGF